MIHTSGTATCHHIWPPTTTLALLLLMDGRHPAAVAQHYSAPYSPVLHSPNTFFNAVSLLFTCNPHTSQTGTKYLSTTFCPCQARTGARPEILLEILSQSPLKSWCLQESSPRSRFADDSAKEAPHVPSSGSRKGPACSPPIKGASTRMWMREAPDRPAFRSLNGVVPRLPSAAPSWKHSALSQAVPHNCIA